jgi:hypothetical protein
MRPQTSRIAARRQAVTAAKEEKDICSLSDDALATFKERRREGRMLDPLAVKQRYHRRHATVSAGPPRDIDIALPKLFQRETDELAASLDGGPII